MEGNAATHAMTLDEAIAHAEDVAGNCDTSCKREHRQLADWLKELRDVKRTPVGNAAALREALESVRNWCVNKLGGASFQATVEGLLSIVESALSEPPRNCEIGTPAEQSVRYEKFCFEHRTMERCCEDCPLKHEPCCELAWAQLPYEEAANADADA